MIQMVFASSNEGKIKEIHTLLKKYNIQVLSSSELDLSIPSETGSTLEENALIKAQSASKTSGLPALADDTGLCVHALKNELGVETARFAEKCGGYAQAFQEILKRLENEKDKTAHFECVLVLSYPNGTHQIFKGKIEGNIVPPQGNNGFGFDAIFQPKGLNKTFAQLSEVEKNKISHRGKAMNAFLDSLGDFIQR